MDCFWWERQTLRLYYQQSRAECSPTRFKTGRLNRCEAGTAETCFWAQPLQPALPEHKIKQKMELFCQRRWMRELIPQGDKHSVYMYQGWQFCKFMRSSEHDAITANTESPQVWKHWVLQKGNTVEMYGEGDGEGKEEEEGEKSKGKWPVQLPGRKVPDLRTPVQVLSWKRWKEWKWKNNVELELTVN